MRRAPSAIDLAGAALLVLLGGVAFGWVFGWRSAEALVWVAIVVSCTVPVLVGGLLHRSGVTRLPVVLLVQAVVWFAAGTALVLAAGGSAGTFASSLGSAWGSLISFTLPAGDDPALLVVPITICWFGAVVATEAAVRTRVAFAPALAGASVLVAARLFGPGGPTESRVGHLALAAAMVVVAVVVGAHRTTAGSSTAEAGGAGGRSSWLRAGLPAALALAVVAGAVGAVVPFGRSAATLRSLHDAPIEDLAVSNPLDALSTDLSGAADQPVLDLAMTVGSVPEGRSLLGGGAPRLRLVTLDRYDGIDWTSGARYLRAGTELPAPTGINAPTVEVSQTIVVAALDGPWLPAVAGARTVQVESAPGVVAGTGPEVAFDASTSGLVLGGGGGATGARYAVVSAVPAVTADELAGAGLPASADLAADIALPPGMPASMGDVANQAMGRAASPFQQLAALETWLRTNGDVDVEAPGGTSYAALTRFVAPSAPPATAASAGTVPPAAPAPGTTRLRGTPQQFAAAFAVLARSRGLPTRVVIGYRTDEAVAAGGATVGVVRGQSAIWPEAYLEGLGWVPFDPLPARGTAPATPAQTKVDEVTQAKTDAVARTDQPDQSIPPAANPIVAAEQGAGATDRWPIVLAVVVAALLLAALVALVVGPLRRRSRRRRLERARRSAPDERARVLGAWHHVLDHLEARGAGPLVSATVVEVVDRSAARWPATVTDPVARLGALVNDTLFDPDASSGSPAGERAAEAWRLADQAVAALAAAPDPVEAAPAAADAPTVAPADQPEPVGAGVAPG